MFEHLPPLLLLVTFILSAIAIWMAGIKLSNATDVLADKWGLGEALGGMILLAVVTNLPEIAITITACLQGKTELAVGNILGGIGIQTVVLVLLDRFGLGRKKGLTHSLFSLSLLLEGLLVIGMLTLVLVGTQLPGKLHWHGITPQGLLLVGTWAAGLFLIKKAKKGLPWKPDPGPALTNKSDSGGQQGSSGKTLFVFLGCALITLVAGYCIEQSGDALANQWGMTGVVFGATILAAATSLPELSTGLQAMKNKDYQLAVSDIFGGNAFLPVLFIVGSVCAGKAILPKAEKSDLYLTAIGMLLTSIYLWGIIFKPKKLVLGMGVDSFVVLLVYLFSIFGLFAVS